MLVLSRQELYEKVWSTPMSRLAADSGISDVALAKVCRKHGIPRPGRGYWAKLAAGVKVRRVALPRSGDAKPIEFVHPARQGRGFPKPPIPVVAVPEAPSALHPVIEWLRDEFKAAKKDKHGRLTVNISYSRGIAVRTEIVDRVIAILDAFAKALVDRGWAIELTRGHRDEPSRLAITVHNQLFGFTLEERFDQVPNPKYVDRASRNERNGLLRIPYTLPRYALRKYDYVPNGMLQLKVYGGATQHCGVTSWSDGAAHRLEDRLGTIIGAMERAGSIQEAMVAEAARVMQEQQAEEARMVEAKRGAELQRRRPARLVAYEAKLGAELEVVAERWSRAKGVRDFLAEYDRRLPQERRSPLDERWYQAGLRHAERLDPLGTPQELAKELQPEDEELARLLGK